VNPASEGKKVAVELLAHKQAQTPIILAGTGLPINSFASTRSHQLGSLANALASKLSVAKH
jgi:hypothetical protein